MDRATFIIALGALVTLWYKSQQTRSSMINWTPPKNAEPFLPLINQAEHNYKLPPTLLARVLDIESAYRQDIIEGKIRSPAGALGIAQIVPKWHPNVDPLDPTQAIPYAARYLSDLKAQFGTWQKAIAAYNWGPGNLQKYLTGEFKKLPEETENYLKKIYGNAILG